MRVPASRLHKASRQAIVTIQSKDHSHGPHGSPESLQKNQTLLAARTRSSSSRSKRTPKAKNARPKTRNFGLEFPSGRGNSEKTP
jgi:hypothetical protein